MPRKLSDYEAALKHQYRVVPSGPPVPGVTSVINILDKPGMVWSAAQIAAETALKEHRRKATIVRRHRKTLTALGKKERDIAYNGSDDEVFIHYCRGEHRRQWDAKMNRGTRIHEVAEAWTKNPGNPVSVLVEDSGFVDALEAFYRDYEPKFIHAELVVLRDEPAYGGRFDAIADTKHGRFLIDYKTGSHYEASLAMQQAAYLMGSIATYDDDGILQPYGKECVYDAVNGALGIYLHDDGTYEAIDPFANVSLEDSFEAFTACLKTFYEMKKINDQIKRN
jgi:hypothetical protein